MIFLFEGNDKGFCDGLTMSINIVGKEQIELPDRYINMVGVDTKTRMKTVG